MLHLLHSDLFWSILVYLPKANKVILRFVCSRFRSLIPPEKSTCSSFVTNLHLLRWARSQGCPLDQHQIFDTAAVEGASLETMQYLLAQECTISWRFNCLLFQAFRSNQDMIAILQWLRQQEPLDKTTSTYAVDHGYLEVFKWMQEEPIYISNDLLATAAKSESPRWLEMFEYILSSCPLQKTDSIMLGAVRSGRLDRIKILEAKGYPLHIDTCRIAAEKGYFDILQYAHGQGHRIDFNILEAAIFQGALPICDWVDQNKTPDNNVMVRISNETSTPELIDWIYAHGYRLSSDTIRCVVHHVYEEKVISLIQKLQQYIPERQVEVCRAAISVNDWNLLLWLKEQGYPWNKELCRAAVEGDNLEILIKLREHGCPWNEDVAVYAVMNENLRVLRWIHQQGVPFRAKEYEQAILAEDLDALRYLHENGCPWKLKYFCDALHTNTSILDFLDQEGFAWDKESLRQEVKRKNEEGMGITDEVKSWLVTHGYLESSEIETRPAVE